MRLIDADALKVRAIRVSTVKAMANKVHCYIKAVGTHEIDKAPTVDAVPVVRCADCRHYNIFRLECHNAHMNGVINSDGFCSYGERRTNES